MAVRAEFPALSEAEGSKHERAFFGRQNNKESGFEKVKKIPKKI
jgi:hypothetical protein